MSGSWIVAGAVAFGGMVWFINAGAEGRSVFWPMACAIAGLGWLILLVTGVVE